MAEHPPRRPRREDEDDSFAERKQKGLPAKKRKRDERANKRNAGETEGEIPVVLLQAAETPEVLPAMTHEVEEKKEGEENADLEGGPAGEDGTRAEWKTRMNTLVDRVQEKLNVAKDASASAAEKVSKRLAESRNYLNARAKEMDAQAEMGGTEKLFRRMGENYNKLSFVHKLGIGCTLGAGAVISVASFTPLMALGFGAALGAQRAFGLGGMFVSQEKALQAKKAGESEQFISVKERAMLNAMLYTLGMSFAIKEGVELANEYGVVERTREWLGEMLGHEAVAIETSAEVAAPLAQEYVAPLAATGIEAPVVPDVPEAPSISVEATKGRGYEYMMKRVWEQLQDKGLDASQYAKDSDIHKLLTATPENIDTVVHQIATDPEHGFFNPDGTSVRIDMGSQMTINADGNIQLGDVVKAPEGAPVTPVYRAEALVSNAEAPATPVASAQEIAPPEPATTAAMTYVPESVGEPYIETPPASPAQEIVAQSPAPIVDRSFVSNRFGLPIPTAEPHMYAGADEKNIFVFGGTPIEMKKTMLDYLKENPNKIVFAASENEKYRLAWHLVGGQIEPAGPPMRTEGFFNSIFNFFRGSSWMKAPGPDDLRRLIK